MSDQGVSVVGHGTASAAPDVVVISLAAEAAGPSVQTVLEQATDAVGAMRSVLGEQGIPAGDIRSGEAFLGSDRFRDGSGDETLLHRARFGLQATVRSLDSAGAVLAAALAAAGEAGRMNGLSFAHSDPSALAAQAREAAFLDARAKAEQYAALAARSLGEVESVSEAYGGPSPVGRAVAMSSPMSAGMPIEGGSLEVGASITVAYGWA